MASAQEGARAASGHRPGFYVHLELGVSWTPRHKPKTRHLSYISRSMRQRACHCPAHVTPSNAGFLAYQPSPYDYDLAYHDAGTSLEPCHHQAHAGHQFPQRLLHHHRPQPQATHPYGGQSEAHNRPRCRSRSRSNSDRPSRSRGSSAPPPCNDSPWDADPEPMMATALPGRKAITHFKALPATPGQFRLGEDGMPWSQGSLGYGDIDDSAVPGGCNPRSDLRLDDREAGRAREMESFAAAMMTVDNGFEDQWWYQGPRFVSVAGDLISPTSLGACSATLGWAVADPETAGHGSPAFIPVVSPISNTSPIV